MRPWLWIGAASLFLCALRAQPPRSIVVIVVADDRGKLEPCGCVTPMSGGLARRLTVIRRLTSGSDSVVVHTGPAVGNPGRQAEMKFETLAEAMSQSGPWALALGSNEAALGQGVAMSFQRLGRQALVSASVDEAEAELVSPWLSTPRLVVGSVTSEPTRIGALLGLRTRGEDSALASVLAEATSRRLPAVLAIDGGESEARRIARANPEFALIVFASSGRPVQRAEREGKTWLASAGDHGRWVVALEWEDGLGAQPRVKVVDLGPEIPDDPATRQILDRYQDRVRSERLIDLVPRPRDDAIAGSATCLPCHAGAAKAWTNSGHARALATLEASGHDRDPDCVGCHVTGLDNVQGFRDRVTTPRLADVGCESCHGPGARHALRPRANPMPKAGAASCLPCHDGEHSPAFDFESKWAKIRH